MSRLAAVSACAALALAACRQAGAPDADPAPPPVTGTPHSGFGPRPPPGTPPATPVQPLTGALALRRAPSYPTRIAEGPAGRIYVTDARAGSLFLHGPTLAAIGELPGLGAPLGVAALPDGTVCVGSGARRAVACFSGDGAPVRTVGDGVLQMPNDLAADRAGNLYVADSAANRVRVFGPGGALARTVGEEGELAFPAAVTVAYPPAHPEGELYVADQRHGRVAVFDLQGTFRRALGQPAPAFGRGFQGLFVRVQAVAVDALGRVHALDAFQHVVQVLDGETGAFVEWYGGFGTGPGQLAEPLGIALLRDGRVLVASAGNRRLEVLRTLAPGQGGTP